MIKVLVEIKFLVEKGAGPFIKTLVDLEHVSGDFMFILRLGFLPGSSLCGPSCVTNASRGW